MTELGDLVHRLRSTPVRDIIRAVERDGFSLKRETTTGARIYAHPDGRLTVIHYHRGSDTLTRKTLRSVLEALKWTEDDLKRLGLLR
jgi:predicted RNA binding protein YcfA (HicA-like mRNA interferase family)